MESHFRVCWRRSKPNPSTIRLKNSSTDLTWCVLRYFGIFPMSSVFQTLENMTCDRNRHELLNILCKICSRNRITPKSMHVNKRLTGKLVEEYSGGQATVFRAERHGCQVAVKMVRIYMTSDFGKCLSVSARHLNAPGTATEPWVHRSFVEKLLHGDISDTQTSYHCSVWTWSGIGLR